MSQPPSIFDTALIARHLARRPHQGDFVTDLVLADLEDRLAALIRAFPRAAIIGPDVDKLPRSGQTASAQFAFERHAAFEGDDDIPALARAQYDLIVSILHLQAVNDVPGYLARLRARLAPDGLLLLASAVMGATLFALAMRGQAILASGAFFPLQALALLAICVFGTGVYFTLVHITGAQPLGQLVRRLRRR